MNKLDQRTYLAKPVSKDGTTADGPREVKIQGRNNNNNNHNNNTVPLFDFWHHSKTKASKDIGSLKRASPVVSV